ncbi:Putative oligoketide cyclase/dehydratase or lipid transport protein YfjG [Thioalkalivibrio nitratireducens DSM 14787]|uniref:Oligoketide cyclase/dehydratase or lipid transport protein YfjG n=1 Tax=Thioalkalivibrio nitratireducens (strain DSM 14787 / UNIQEM 213 / ALEN2) TaxID=1255043 RepID=L0E2B4_THIND|nr:type II toxin-antitoxin system RatA family toxin [Thioalkalivibrio nitratireducens]AGA34796.1 Putative oligoketide cyclase/dehydratase or lipid transport protein YfjG [Thioalkalivibrio nitratireducens DSM 14787]
MPSRIQRSAVVPYSPEQMFALVNDIDAYPEFLPHCRSARVLETGEAEVKARIELAKGALHKSFTTRNRLDPPHRIRMQLVDGPFRRLQGGWQFNEHDGGTRIVLDLEFEFSNRLMAMALGPVFNQLANSLVDAFVRRARVVHGTDDG